MNEVCKKITICAFGILLGVFGTCVFTAKSIRSDNRASREAREYREKFEDSSRRLEYCKTRVESISAELNRDEQTISGVCQALREIATRVQEMEDCLYNNGYDCSRNVRGSRDVLLLESLKEMEDATQ